MRLARVILQAMLAGELILGVLVFSQIEEDLAFSEQAVAYPEGVRQEIWVFEPFSSKTKKGLRNTLSQTFPHLNLTIFTRYREFRKALFTDLPDAILTRPVVLNAFPSLQSTTILEGSLAGRFMEPFVFIAHKSLYNKQTLTLGAVDIIGKKETEAWLAKLMPNKTINLKLVSRLEDLQSLLLFNYVDAIVAPVKDVGWFQSKTERELLIFDAFFTVHLPVIVVMKKTGRQPLIHPSQNYATPGLGIERWTRISEAHHPGH